MELFLHLGFLNHLSKSITARKTNMSSLRKYREKLLLSKAELARKAGLSPLTIDRIERGLSCRLETKRKIILALGLQFADKGKLFGDDRS